MEKGRLYRSGLLTIFALRFVYRRYSIKTIVNLACLEDCTEGKWFTRHKEFCHRHHIKLIHIPMRPGTPAPGSWISSRIRLLPASAFLPATR